MAGRLAFAIKLEQAVAIERVKPGPALPPNAEIMAALLLDVGIERGAFIAVFAIGRSVGWIAHALERYKTGRMIRPTSARLGWRVMMEILARRTILASGVGLIVGGAANAPASWPCQVSWTCLVRGLNRCRRPFGRRVRGRAPWDNGVFRQTGY
jgi:citrate synthase